MPCDHLWRTVHLLRVDSQWFKTTRCIKCGRIFTGEDEQLFKEKK